MKYDHLLLGPLWYKLQAHKTSLAVGEMLSSILKSSNLGSDFSMLITTTSPLIFHNLCEYMVFYLLHGDSFKWGHNMNMLQ